VSGGLFRHLSFVFGLSANRVVRQLGIEGDAYLQGLLPLLPKHLSVLHLPPLDEATTQDCWEDFWEWVGDHPTLTTVTIPSQPNVDQRNPDAALETLFRTVILYGAIKKSCTLVAVNHDSHLASGPWGVDEAFFNGPIARLLAANRQRTARLLLKESLNNDRVMEDELLLQERVYLALVENVAMWLPRARKQDMREALRVAHRPVIRELRRRREILEEVQQHLDEFGSDVALREALMWQLEAWGRDFSIRNDEELNEDSDLSIDMDSSQERSSDGDGEAGT
jgi:hypothetical protein